MIKQTLYFGNPAYLKTKDEQLVIERKDEPPVSRPIEDIGVILLDNPQITLTQPLLAKLLAHNVALITCDPTHHPVGLFLPLEGHTLQSKFFKAQVEASLPLKKQLWQQTVAAKIYNQAQMLAHIRQPHGYLLKLSKEVKSNDAGNLEAKAAVYYWKHLFPDFLNFTRLRDGNPPNNLLNYGYALLRAIVARSLVGSGLMPTLGIFHRNQYNAFCLADDIMEPYRPYVDRIVCHIVEMNGPYLQMTPDMKRQLLAIPTIDVSIDGQTSPLMIAVQRTTASLVRCFEGRQKKIIYPAL